MAIQSLHPGRFLSQLSTFLFIPTKPFDFLKKAEYYTYLNLIILFHLYHLMTILRKLYAQKFIAIFSVGGLNVVEKLEKYLPRLSDYGDNYGLKSWILQSNILDLEEI